MVCVCVCFSWRQRCDHSGDHPVSAAARLPRQRFLLPAQEGKAPLRTLGQTGNVSVVSPPSAPAAAAGFFLSLSTNPQTSRYTVDWWLTFQMNCVCYSEHFYKWETAKRLTVPHCAPPSGLFSQDSVSCLTFIQTIPEEQLLIYNNYKQGYFSF